MSEIEISEIQVIPIKPKEGLVAFASCVINDSLYIGSVAVYSSPSAQSGFRLVYPTKILPNSKTISCVHPLNKDVGELISKAIINKFKEIISKAAG